MRARPRKTLVLRQLPSISSGMRNCILNVASLDESKPENASEFSGKSAENSLLLATG